MGSTSQDSQSKKQTDRSRSRSVVIELRGGGNVVSFKNTKMIAGIRRANKQGTVWHGRPFVKTDTRKAGYMERTIQGIECALRTLYQTEGIATATGCSLQSWIASSLPLDDSLKWIPKSDGWDVEYVREGMEGFRIEFERIDEDGEGVPTNGS